MVTVLLSTLATMHPRIILLALVVLGMLTSPLLANESEKRSRRSAEEKKDNLIFRSEDHPDSTPKPELTEVVLEKKRPEPKPKVSPRSILNYELPTRNPPKYRLKPGDRIEVSVWGEDMTRDLVVGPDGRISYILVGEINVLDMSFSELKAELEKRLDPYLIDPNVSIIGISYEGNHVSILGAVSRPGQIVISGSDRVLDVLAKAGGLRFEEFGNNQGEIANLQNAYMSRKGKMIPVDFSRLLYEGDMTQNVPVNIGDFIYIPSSLGQPIYVTGEVGSPAAIPFRGQPTLLDAISSSGGINNKGQKSRIYLVRGGMVDPDITTYSFYKIVKGKEENVKLEPGDIIYVPPTTLTRIERLSGQIIPFLNTITSSKSAKTAVENW